MDCPDWTWNFRTRLSAPAKATYAALLAFRQRDTPGQEVWPSLATLAAATGHSRDTVRRKAIPELEAAGLIEVRRTKAKAGEGAQRANRYVITAPKERPASLTISNDELNTSDRERREARADRRARRHDTADTTPGLVAPGYADPDTTPGLVAPTQGLRAPTPRGPQPHESLPVGSLPENPHTSELASLDSDAGDDPFGIEEDDPISEVVSPPSAADAAAPRAYDDEDGSVCEVDARSAMLALRDVGEPTERQIEMLRDLYLLAYGVAPDWRFFNNARRLDQDGVTRYRRELYAAIPHGRGHAYDGPEPGDGVYELLSQHGRAWADVGLDPSEAPFIRHDLAERLGEGGR